MLTFLQLEQSLFSPSSTQNSIDALLNQHTDSLFSALSSSFPEKSEGGNDNQIKYLRHSKTTSRFPTPTDAENVCIQSLQTHFSIRRSYAANLIRDFLDEYSSEPLVTLLESESNLTSFAPLYLLKTYWLRETHLAFSVILSLLLASNSKRNTTPSSQHSNFEKSALKFISQNYKRLKDVILQSAEHVISSFADTTSNTSPGTRFHAHWYMRLLFALSLHTPLSVSDRNTLLSAYCEVADRKQRFSTHFASDSPRPSVSTLDGDEISVLFVASLNHANSVSETTRIFSNDDNDVENNSNNVNSASNTDNDVAQQLDKLYVKMRCDPSPESAMLSLSWASLRQLLVLKSHSRPSQVDTKTAEEIIEHMSFAISSNAFMVLQNIVDDLSLPSNIAPPVFRCFWDDLVAFFTAYPPRDFLPRQVSQMVTLATSLLHAMTDLDVQQVAQDIWQRESTSRALIGANAILRIATGVFPQTYRPLINFLSALVVHPDSAQQVLAFLCERLTSVSESASAYQDALYVLDEDETDILHSVCYERQLDIDHVSRALDMVRFSDEDIMFVQAGMEIPADTYRPKIAKGSIGLTNISQTFVTWIMPWNGFGAVGRILHFLLSVFNDQDSATMHDDSVLDELSTIAADSMALIDRLFAVASIDVANDYLADSELVRVIASIVAEVSDPGDRARSSWLTKSRQERLLMSGMSCLASISCNNADRARLALDTLEVSKSTFPLLAAAASLNATAFPAVAAVARIAYVASHSDVVSLGLRTVLSASTPRVDGRFSTASWYGKDSAYVSDFLTGNVIPLWLTTSPTDAAKTTGNVHGAISADDHQLHWLLPACSMELFTADPALVLQSPVVSALFSAIIFAACTNLGEKEPNKSGSIPGNNSVSGGVVDTFLFPALRAALTACYIALRERNKCLMDAVEGKSQESVMNSKIPLDETTTFENTLLKPDMTYAMALLSTGVVKKLETDDFFERCEQCPFGGFMAKHDDSDLFWMFCPDWKYRNESGPEYWRSWIAGMSARCLALQFCCLSQLHSGDDAIQVAWPSVQKSLIENWRGGGVAIRRAFAHLIKEEKSVPHIELIVTALACGQRAAARALFAPISSSIQNRLEKEKSRDSGATDSPADAKSDDRMVISAILNCLQESQEEWVKKAEQVPTGDASEDDISRYIEVGQACLRIAACVRFLRVARETQTSKWFEYCWTELKVWEVLGSLVRCKGSNARQSLSVDFAQAIDYPEPSIMSLERLAQVEGRGWNGLRSLTKEMTISVDVSACWKVIAADVLQMFASEISYKTTTLLKLPQVEKESKNGTNKDDGGKEMFPVEVFTEGVFAQFSSVFTEKWMHVLFKLSDHSNETSSALERRVSRRNLQEPSNASVEKYVSVEKRCHELSTSLSSLIFKQHKLSAEEVLGFFDRGGDVITRFGADYCFDNARVLRFLDMAGRSVNETCDVLRDFSRINMDMTIQDVQAEVVRAFSAMSSAVVFADSFCPQPSALLSYSSPQFGGKVCRFLSRYLLFISPMLSSSGHAVGVTSEISMLMASLSTRLSTDELDQPALTAVRFQSLELPEELSSLNVVGQLCVVIDDVMDSVEGISKQSKAATERLDIARWLLLTASKLAHGAAFRSRGDLMALTRCVMRVLRENGNIPFVCAACSVALSSVMEQNLDGWTASLDPDDVKTLVKTISSLSSVKESDKDKSREISANLLLIIAQGYFLQGNVDNTTRSFVIRQLAGGTVMGLLPPESESVFTYDSSAESRNAAHILWCASLRLAGVAIADAAEIRRYGSGENEIRDVLEFSVGSLRRIGRDGLNLSGDWPPSKSRMDTNESKCITIAKVEEAELSALTLFRLSGYAFHLRSTMPEGLRTVVAELIRYADHALRLLRAEPVERWVRPITRRECERSYLLRGERDSHGNLISTSGSSPWSGSPGRTVQTPGSPTPVKRSPMQALRAAIGDGSNRGSPLAPSPGFTPASPSTGMPGSGQMSSSPLSPWIPYGAGLISETGLYFGEEVSRSLLRGLASALTALRRFATEMEVVLFSTSLVTFDDPPGLGSLINILHHAGGELQRGTDEVRHGLLLTIAENAFMLMVFHVRLYVQQDALPQHVRDELRKRIPTYVLRMRRCIPPPPSYSVLSAVEIDWLWEQLR